NDDKEEDVDLFSMMNQHDPLLYQSKRVNENKNDDDDYDDDNDNDNEDKEEEKSHHLGHSSAITIHLKKSLVDSARRMIQSEDEDEDENEDEDEYRNKNKNENENGGQHTSSAAFFQPPLSQDLLKNIPRDNHIRLHTFLQHLRHAIQHDTYAVLFLYTKYHCANDGVATKRKNEENEEEAKEKEEEEEEEEEEDYEIVNPYTPLAKSGEMDE
ncbi:PHD-finger family protein, partial [Reticulomyxa filosa]